VDATGPSHTIIDKVPVLSSKDLEAASAIQSQVALAAKFRRDGEIRMVGN